MDIINAAVLLSNPRRTDIRLVKVAVSSERPCHGEPGRDGFGKCPTSHPANLVRLNHQALDMPGSLRRYFSLVHA